MATLDRWTPLRELDLIDRQVRRFFADLGFAPVFVPAADVYETDGEYVVELEVPGFEQQQLAIEVFDHTLTVTGRREEETTTEEKTLRLRERLEKEFVRSFTLPAVTDSDHVTAKYVNGVLTLHVPKTETALPRKVEITKA
jgi:HSP20 family protein